MLNPQARRSTSNTIIVRFLVLSLLGTSLAVFPGGGGANGPTGKRDGVLAAGWEYLVNAVWPAAQGDGGDVIEPIEDDPFTEFDPAAREARAAGFNLCRLSKTMYVGEASQLSAPPVDAQGQPVHGVVARWYSSDASTAEVSVDGEVLALRPGHCVLTAELGQARLDMALTVLDGERPVLTDEEWDAVSRDGDGVCDREPGPGTGEERSPGEPGGYIDGNGGDGQATIEVTQFNNAVGSPLYDPQEVSTGGGARVKKNLGSDNFNFAAPAVGLPGRGGLDLNLGLSYNSRVWSKDLDGANPDKIKFNYGKGWPAVGWTLGFGRIIENYDVSSGNGNYQLIQPDGTRVHLQRISTTPPVFQSQNGTFIELRQISGTWRLRYPDGTRVTYETVNNRLLPTTIRTITGNKIDIVYKTYVNTGGPGDFKYRWAIQTITDTLGRQINFEYSTVNGRLLRVKAPGYNGGADRVMVEFGYQDITLTYNFGGLTVENAPASGSLVSVLNTIYYPATGAGYVFEYSSYAMMKSISTRVEMIGASPSGLETAKTSVTYQDTGTLSDAPRYDTRTESWKTMSESSNTLTTTTAAYSYSRSGGGGGDEVVTMTYPSPNTLVVKTTTGGVSGSPDFGRVKKVQYLNNTTLLREITYGYNASSGGANMLGSVVDATKKDNGSAAQTRQTDYEYWTDYGRVKNIREYSGASVRRRTYFEYKDGTGYTDDNHILNLVTLSEVYNGNDVRQAKTKYTIDDYSIKGGLYNYGLTTAPPGFASNFLSTSTDLNRGNVTQVERWIDANGTSKITRQMQYDVFGNLIEADVSCCALKEWGFTSATQYAHATTATDGGAGLALSTSYGYDFDTSLMRTMTDVRGDVTTYNYIEASWRLDNVIHPALAGQTRLVDLSYFDGSNGATPALPTVTSRVDYTDYTSGGTTATKSITSKQWYDGAGRVLRGGTGAGSTPSGYDMVMTKYDGSGRPNQQSNPYAANSSGTATGTVRWTTTSYDALSRARTVTLPDNQTVQTLYEGSAAMEITDQAGRRRRMEYDELGRMTKVVEHNPSGTFSATDPNWTTTYTFDTLDSLETVTQGTQTRTYVYDDLSRLVSQTTPEAGTVSYALTDFGAVKTMTDARSVETHYMYDGLNRLKKVWYTGIGGNEDGTVRPALPAGVEATSDVDIAYNTTGDGKGQIMSVDNGVGSEAFAYDTLGRVQTRTWTMDGTGRQTSYSYNAADQLRDLTYPSARVARHTYDDRGRLDALAKSNAPAATYISDVDYDSASLVTGVDLGNGVTESYAYDQNRLQLTNQTAVNGTTTLLNLTYNYTTTAANQLGQGSTSGKNAGQLIGISGSVSVASANQAFTYDTLGRLATATGPGTGGGPSGTDTIGTHYFPSGNSSFFLKNTNSGGSADVTVVYGGSGITPLAGDWDADGDDSIGAYVPSTSEFQLRNTNTPGGADLVYQFGVGGSGYTPLVGDWDGDGDDTAGLYDPGTSTFFLKNSHSGGAADVTVVYGSPNTYTPLVGDWDGDGDDTIGLYNPANGSFLLKNTNTGGAADLTFFFGTGSATPVKGDWDGDGGDTVGLYVPASGLFYLRNSNSSGAADYTVFFGEANSTPLTGDWDNASAGIGWQRGYTHDRWGNRTQMRDATSGGNVIQSITIATTGGAPNNRISTVDGGSAYTYDGNGNLTNDTVYKYGYDAANRLVALRTQAGTDVERYKYDAGNRRVRVEDVATGMMRRYIWEGMHVIVEYVGTTLDVEYIFAGGRMVAREQGSVRLFLHQDRLSPRLLTDSSGNWAGSQSHLPFGEADVGSGASEKRQFTNYERDGVAGTDYGINRQYAFALGRFFQPDPIEGGRNTPQTYNRYTYTVNDPIGLVDPLGLDPVAGYINPQGGFSIFDVVSLGSSALFAVFSGWMFRAGNIPYNPYGRSYEQASSDIPKAVYNDWGYGHISNYWSGRLFGALLSATNECNSVLESLFGGMGVVARSGIDFDGHFRAHFFGVGTANHNFHLYANKDGSSGIGLLYVPTANLVSAKYVNDPKNNTNYARFVYADGSSLSFQHVSGVRTDKGTNKDGEIILGHTNAAGSAFFGFIGGPGGNAPGNFHSHVIYYQSAGQSRNPAFVDCLRKFLRNHR